MQGTLTCLAVFVNLETFHRTSPVAHLLPQRSYFLSHPIDYLSQYLTIYKMHVNARSVEVQAQRDRKLEDLQKRDQYRKAHGIEDSQYVFGFGRRLYKVDKKEEEEKVGDGDGDAKREPTIEEKLEEQRRARREEYVDIYGRKKPVVKKWLGIWS